jgi:hypothetical protein
VTIPHVTTEPFFARFETGVARVQALHPAMPRDPVVRVRLRLLYHTLRLLSDPVVLAAALGYGAYWLAYGRSHVGTDDAYVGGNVVQVTPQVDGTVVAVNADAPRLVKEGDVAGRALTPCCPPSCSATLSLSHPMR